jgi:YidC/Oxa1 family membrane protein insertase
VPDPRRSGARRGTGALTAGQAGHARLDNGEGLEFRRTISVGRQVPVHRQGRGEEHRSRRRSSLHPYALISRHGTPKTDGYYILHEGPIGVLGDQG